MRTLAAFLCLLPWLTLAQVPTMPGGAVPWYKKPSDGDTNIPTIFWWKLNEGTGTHISGAASNGGDDGTTSASWDTGESGVGYSQLFDASGTYAQTDSNITFGTNELTVTFWVKPHATTNAQSLVGTWDGNNPSSAVGPLWEFYIQNNKLYITAFGPGQSHGQWISFTNLANVWTHVAVNFTGRSGSAGGYMYAWTNAVSVTPTSSTTTYTGTTTFCSTNKIEVGTQANGSQNKFDGGIDDIRVFYGALTASQITNIYQHPK